MEGAAVCARTGMTDAARTKTSAKAAVAVRRQSPVKPDLHIGDLLSRVFAPPSVPPQSPPGGPARIPVDLRAQTHVCPDDTSPAASRHHEVSTPPSAA